MLIHILFLCRRRRSITTQTDGTCIFESFLHIENDWSERAFFSAAGSLVCSLACIHKNVIPNNIKLHSKSPLIAEASPCDSPVSNTVNPAFIYAAGIHAPILVIASGSKTEGIRHPDRYACTPATTSIDSCFSTISHKNTWYIAINMVIKNRLIIPAAVHSTDMTVRKKGSLKSTSGSNNTKNASIPPAAHLVIICTAYPIPMRLTAVSCSRYGLLQYLLQKSPDSKP